MPNTRMDDADHALAHMATHATKHEAKEKSTPVQWACMQFCYKDHTFAIISVHRGVFAESE